MRQTPMRNLLGLIIATFCLMWIPAQAQTQTQAAKQGQSSQAGQSSQDS